jgi:hypothetical protein
LILAALLAGLSLPAQTPLSNLVFSVGTTIQSGAQNWSYVLIGAQQPSLLAGKRFDVFSKPGYATNAGAFTLRGVMSQQTDAGAITSLLNQSVVLGQNLTSLSNALNVALHKISGATNLPLAQKILTAFQAAGSDPSMLGTLALLARNNPGLCLCGGQAFSEIISGVTTYEIREVNPATGLADEVVGRVTLTPGSPVILPAPGFPFQIASNAAVAIQIFSNQPAIQPVIRLRWGTPPELRRLALLSYGFNVWRMPAATAVNLGFNLTPPTLAQLYANAVAANDAPVISTKDFSAASGPGTGGADDLADDSTTYFFADDNGYKYGMPAFADGAQFYYFITARDLLGRDGLVSPGSLATACRENTPSAPVNLRVQNVLQTVPVPGGTTNLQCLLLSWNQNTDTNDQVTEYWVYRWDNPTMALTNDAAPLSNRVAVVAQLAGTNVNRYFDSGTNSPLTPGATNYWFTIRAVSEAACGPLLSPHSAPVWGVLRERTAPAAAGGELLGSCGTPAVIFQNFATLTNSAETNAAVWNYQFTCLRRDRSIAWAQFTASSSNGVTALGPVYFSPDDDSVSANFSQPAGTNFELDVTCEVGTFYGATSQLAACSFTAAVPTNTQAEAIFYAGQLQLTALNSTDPLLLSLNNGHLTFSPAHNVTRYPDGSVSMNFSEFNNSGLPQFVQVFSNSIWVDIGIAWPDTNHLYWISYPACLLGPLPSFQGAVVHLPDTGICDQHIARTADAGAVAPILVRFRPTARTHEYRLYRSVNGGPLALLARGAATFDTINPSRAIVVPDDTMPPGAAELCYFVQVLDENGNGSPLSFLGCKTVKPPSLPRPVLAEPAVAGDVNNPQVLLNWFCPTGAVRRFQIQIERADQPGSGKPTGFSALKLLKVPNYSPQKFYVGLLANRFRLSRFDEGYLTPPVGANFGPGPQFSLTASVATNVPYNISVAAVGDQDEPHVFSAVWKFTWTPTNPISGVPWPARPLPPVTTFDEIPGTDRVTAVIMRYDTGNAQTYLDTRYPVGIRIGNLASYSALYYGGLTMNVGTTNFFRYQPASFEHDPTRFLFARLSQNPEHCGQPLLPIVVYRQQVANGAFPKVSGSLIQVTPLIERLAWNYSPGIFGGTLFIPPSTVVYDLLIAAGRELVPQAGTFTYGYYVYLRDQQPVIVGASYHYYVARMNDQHEIAEIIDAGIVTVPPN